MQKKINLKLFWITNFSLFFALLKLSLHVNGALYENIMVPLKLNIENNSINQIKINLIERSMSQLNFYINIIMIVATLFFIHLYASSEISKVTKIISCSMAGCLLLVFFVSNRLF